MKKTLLLIVFVLTNITAFSQSESDIDPTFNTGTGFNGVVNCTRIQSDGKILVGGNFSNYNGATVQSIVRLNSDGSRDTTFNLPALFNNVIINVIEFQPDGKILIGGSFNLGSGGGGVANANLTRLNTDGSRDTSFTYNVAGAFNGPVYSLKVTSNEILVGGAFTTYRGVTSQCLIDLNYNGSIFGGNTNVYGSAFTGSINVISNNMLGGAYQYATGSGSTAISRNPVVRLNSVYGIDTTFYGTAFTGGGSGVTVNAIAWQPDGKFLIGGSYTYFNGSASNRLIRLNSDMTKDNTFIGQMATSTSATQINAIVLRPNGKILIGGNPSTGIRQLNSDGTTDNTFFGSNTGTSSGVVNTITLQSDGKILVGGNFTTYNGATANRLVRLKGTTALSTNDFTKTKITLYPNPTKEVLNFTLPETDTATAYEINNLLGEKVSYGNLNSNSISVNNIANGIYIIKIKTNDGVLTSKFIKE